MKKFQQKRVVIGVTTVAPNWVCLVLGGPKNRCKTMTVTMPLGEYQRLGKPLLYDEVDVSLRFTKEPEKVIE